MEINNQNHSGIRLVNNYNNRNEFLCFLSIANFDILAEDKYLAGWEATKEFRPLSFAKRQYQCPSLTGEIRPTEDTYLLLLSYFFSFFFFSLDEWGDSSERESFSKSVPPRLVVELIQLLRSLPAQRQSFSVQSVRAVRPTVYDYWLNSLPPLNGLRGGNELVSSGIFTSCQPHSHLRTKAESLLVSWCFKPSHPQWRRVS